jgi:putative transposase
MAQSLSNIVVHLVFSTKDRQTWLRDAERDELHAYMTGIIRGQNSTMIEINSVEDHCHILFAQSKTHAPAKVIGEVKTHSSLWIKEKGSWYAGFHWQRGYGEFSVSPTHVDRVRLYIRRQREHHARIGFQSEFRRLCLKNHVTLDERYAWD